MKKNHSVEEFSILTPFSIKKTEGEKGAAVEDFTTANTITIEGYCNWSGKSAMGVSYVDLAGDVVVPAGVDTSVWESNPQILWQHDREQSIGKGIRLEKREDGLYIVAEIHRDAMDPKDFYRISSGLVCMFSIGFRTLDCEWKEVDGQDVFFITKCLLLENSVVTIPCNSQSGFSVMKSLPGVGFTSTAQPLPNTELDAQEDFNPMKIKVNPLDLLTKEQLDQATKLGLDAATETEVELIDLIKRISFDVATAVVVAAKAAEVVDATEDVAEEDEGDEAAEEESDEKADDGADEKVEEEGEEPAEEDAADPEEDEEAKAAIIALTKQIEELTKQFA